MDRKNNITLSGITNFLETGALLRRGGQWILIEGPFVPTNATDSGEITVFFPDFYDINSASLWRGQRAFVFSTEELAKLWDLYLSSLSKAEEIPLKQAPWREPAKEDFAQALSDIQERIRQGAIQKAVPVVFARSSQTLSLSDKARLLRRLLHAPANLFVYGFWQDGEGILGATPEVLFAYEKNVLTTMALAGTCPKSEATQRSSLLEDEKEMLEHHLVVQDLKQTLQDLGEVNVSPTEVLELPTLYHLKTDFRVLCRTTPSLTDLAALLHPTPALGVAPRSAGYQWMKDLPGQEGRGGFGAPFGFFHIGERGQEALCLVAIRNMQWNKQEVKIGSGCGIVAASELEREWRELAQKRLSVKKILGLER